jgi:Tol biopolymer transport system component
MSTPAIDTRDISIRPITEHGQVIYFASISGDGRLVAYGRREGERSLRVKQVTTGSEVTVVPPQAGFFGAGATFTPDGDYLYYTHEDPANANNMNVYAVPALGGASRQVVNNVSSTVAFSRDGKRMVYGRTILDKDEDQLLVANTDGTDESVFFRHEGKINGLSTPPSWSASGDLIAVGTRHFGENTLGSILVLTPQGKLVRSFTLPMFVEALAWLPDSSGLLFVGHKKLTARSGQIWFQPYPAGEPFKISNDLSRYYSLSITADGKSFVTTQQRLQATIYVGDSPAVLHDKIDWKLTPISTEQATGYNLSWTAAGQLLQEDGAYHIFVTRGDGADRVRLLENTEVALEPTACGPGDIIVLSRVLEDNVPHVWRLNTVTGELQQLTFGKWGNRPSCSPDGKWVVYRGYEDNQDRIFKVSINGGTPVELFRGRAYGAAVSPDGSLVAYLKFEGQGSGTKTTIVLQRLEGGPPVQEIEVPSKYDVQYLSWTPDGRALTYVDDTTGNTQNLYMQPLAGGTRTRLTHFDSEPAKVVAYAWSRDGKKFAITRALYNDTDVVLFSGFR